MAHIVDVDPLLTLTTAEQAVYRLVAECRKGGLLYNRNPKAVAQVNRTAKWLLNAIIRVRRELDSVSTDDAQN